MAELRDSPYVWVTWLASLMSGDASCEWAPWFRTHHTRWDQPPSDFDEVTYKMNHTRLLREVRHELTTASHQLLIEGQGQFYYRRGSGLTLSGKPDMVAIDQAGRGTVYDAKTGRPKASDRIQAMIYMHCLPQSHPQFSGLDLAGELVYRDHRVKIPASAINSEFVDNFNYFLDILDSGTPPVKVPSPMECRYCNIAKSECPERVEE